MEPHALVRNVFKTISEDGRTITHPSDSVAVSTKRFGTDLWTLILSGRRAAFVHAYQATPNGYELHDVPFGSGAEQDVGRVLMNEAVAVLNSRLPYVLAGDDEKLDIPAEESSIARTYRELIAQRVHDTQITSGDFIDVLAQSLEKVLWHESANEQERYLN